MLRHKPVRLIDAPGHSAPLNGDEPEEVYGLICKAEQDGERIELPLDHIDVPEDSLNRHLPMDA